MSTQGGVKETHVGEALPAPPSIAAALGVVDEILSKRTVIGEVERTAVVLWAAHTYVYDRGFTYTPRLFVTSLSASSGKSTLMRLIATCSDGGRKMEKPVTTFATIRDFKPAGQHATLCLDQLDGTGNSNSEDSHLLNLFCSSTEVGAEGSFKVKVKDEKGERFETAFVNIGYPCALGKIGSLPGDAINSRFIIIAMQPETKEEREEQMTERLSPLDSEKIRGELRTALAGFKAVYIKTEALSRDEDMWQPLLAIGKAAGEGWFRRAQKAMEVLCDRAERAESREVALLRRALALTRPLSGKGITTADLDRRLGVSEEGTVNATRRGIWFKHLGLRSEKLVWEPEGKQVPGYHLEAMREVGKRYGLLSGE